MRTHELKILPIYFRDMVARIKTFEIRYDDRGYQVGDHCIFDEWDGSYLGRKIRKRITYVLKNFEGLKDGFVALGLEDL